MCVNVRGGYDARGRTEEREMEFVRKKSVREREGEEGSEKLKKLRECKNNKPKVFDYLAAVVLLHVLVPRA